MSINLVNQYISFNIILEPYYNINDNNYYHIITTNKRPTGPLNNYVKLVSIKNPSTKTTKSYESYCGYVIESKILSDTLSNINNNISYCTIENITDIYNFLINNNYEINERMSNILVNYNNSKKIIFVVNYRIN